jgi:hypothetical protein
LRIDHPRGKDLRAKPDSAPQGAKAVRAQARPRGPSFHALVRHGAAFDGPSMPVIRPRRDMMNMSRSLGSVALKLQQQEAKFRQAAVSALPALKQGRPFEKPVDGWLVACRAVRAKGECIGCHRGAREGETLGVIVYAVREAIDPSVPKVAASGFPHPIR